MTTIQKKKRLQQTVFSANNTPEYKEITSKRQTEYYIEQNIDAHPDALVMFEKKKEKEKEWKKPDFSGVFHKPEAIDWVNLDDLIISEDLAQRNPLAPDRVKKTVAMAVNFDPRQAKPLQVDVIQGSGGTFKMLRDGGGTATAGYMAGLRELPAIFYNATPESSNYNFRAQHNYVAKISEYTKFLSDLNKTEDCTERRQAVNIFDIAKSVKVNLDLKEKNYDMTVDALGLFKRTIRRFGGDPDNTSWGKYQAPRLKEALNAIEEVYLEQDGKLTIPGSFLEALTCFVHVSDLKLPTDTTERQEHLSAFLKELKSEYKLDETMSKLSAGSSNDYGWQGAIALMKEWSKVMPIKNRGRGKKRYHKFDDFDYKMVEASKGTRSAWNS